MSIRVRRVWACDVCGNRILMRDRPMHGPWEQRWLRVAMQDVGSRWGSMRAVEHFDTCSHRCRKLLWARMATCDVPNDPWAPLGVKVAP